MPVPKEYLQVKRPKNTICKMIGNKCAVIERVGCKRVNGKNIPMNGHVIGHIIDSVYVPKSKVSFRITLKNYGDFAMADMLSSEILNDLIKVYGDEGTRIYCIAMLRALNPRLTDNQIDDEYEESFISEKYKGLSLGRSTVSTLIENIGKDAEKSLRFMQTRVERIGDEDLVAVDGMLSPNNSRVNSLSEFSFKGRIKSSRDLSQIIAFNTATKEIICSLPYPGNTVDIVSFPDFIKKIGIKNGIVVTDKAGSGIDTLGVGYIHPLKRNAKIIDALGLYDMDDRLPDKEKAIQCRKAHSDGKYYYAYRDVKRAAKEMSDYMKSKNYSLEKLKNKQESFGTVVYVSDRDLTLKEAYEIYGKRWEIELINKFYKTNWRLGVREHGDYSVYGTEFINMLSSIIGSKLKNKFEETGLFEKHTYGEIMKYLRRYKKAKDPKDVSRWIETAQAKKGVAVLEKLGVYSG